ncbi:cAMP-dependent protein kinase type II-alpha regulatory subunit [Fasciola hepatica]|uniref:cAMP-dependent protein kinase type II-alpha regulatory subunit n=1 Tax=Fasciola hepatica TaxID=6192 RepID=A0A4E0RES2_FASHE|nr:cAMP-dependent protein kinase type II-alpha regulatory subunit [Fasciola hepatica]
MEKSATGNRPRKPADSEKEEDEEPMPTPPRYVGRRAGLAAESCGPEKDGKSSRGRVVHPKTEVQRLRSAQPTKNILLFRCFDDDQMKDFIDATFEQHFSPGEKVITLDEYGDKFYVIEKRVFDIIVKIQGEEKAVGKYDNKGSFWELVLMYNTPRAATILATNEGVLWAMTCEVFRSIVLKRAFEKHRMYKELLNQVTMLESLSAHELMGIADALKALIFEDGAPILKQGDSGDEMFSVEDREVVIKMKSIDESEEKELPRIEKGGYFGELALLTSHSRAASAYAAGRTKFPVIDVGSFERLLGPCLSILQGNTDGCEQKLKSFFGSLDKVPELQS